MCILILPATAAICENLDELLALSGNFPRRPGSHPLPSRPIGLHPSDRHLVEDLVKLLEPLVHELKISTSNTCHVAHLLGRPGLTQTMVRARALGSRTLPRPH